MCASRLVLCLGACLSLGQAAAAAPMPSADEQALRQAGVATDGPGLIAFLRTRSGGAADEARLKTLIRRLGADSFEAREEASHRLVAIGARARILLQEALRSKDPEVVHRAQDVLGQIDRGVTGAVVAAAVRTLGRLQPDGAAEALLAYLPAAEDMTVAEEVRAALASVAVRAGKPQPAVLAALADATPARRAAAGAALARAGVLAPVRRLLSDPDPEVRLRVGMALVRQRERAAVPALIALLDKPPAEGIGRVEDLLYRLAGDKAPTVLPGKDAASQRRYREGWEAWWKEHGARLDPARLEEATRTLGYTLVVLLDQGKVVDLDAANRPRWEVGGLEFPLDAQVLPGDRVLVAEHGGNRVTERNRKGEVLWEKKIASPLMAQRLPNGHTFIAGRNQVIEVDRTGKEVWQYTRPGGESIMRAARLRNGDVALITQLGVPRYVRVDRSGKELSSFGVDVRTSGGRVAVLPNGHVLIPEMANNRVVELDESGKVVWTVAVEQPIVAVRLPNGHTLVTSMTQNRALELDRAGKEVWQFRADTRVTRAVRR